MIKLRKMLPYRIRIIPVDYFRCLDGERVISHSFPGMDWRFMRRKRFEEDIRYLESNTRYFNRPGAPYLLRNGEGFHSMMEGEYNYMAVPDLSPVDKGEFCARISKEHSKRFELDEFFRC